MKRLFFLTLSVLLGISVLRLVMGRSPMSLSTFLNSLTNVDISFEHTLEQIADVRAALVFPSMDTSNFFQAIGNFFVWVYNLSKNIIMVPIELVHDVLDFLASILQFFQVLIT